MPLLSLPFDVLSLLLSVLSGESLSKCKEVCKTLSTLIEKDTRLQYHLELYRLSLIDEPRRCVGVPTSKRLESIRALCSRRLRWRETWPEGSIPGTQVTTGLQDWTWDYSSKTLAGFIRDSSIGVWTFTGESPIPYRKRVVDLQLQPGIHKRLYVDPMQDLLIVMDAVYLLGGPAIRIYFQSLVDGATHPLALQRFTDVKDTFAIALGYSKARIYGKLLAICIRSYMHNTSGDRILIVDWMEGKVLSTISGHACMFLDSQHLLVALTNGTSNGIEVHVHAIGREQPLLILPLPKSRHQHCDFGRDIKEDSTPPFDNYPCRVDPACTMIAISLAGPVYDLSQVICTFPALVINELLSQQYGINSTSAPKTLMIPWGSWPQCIFAWPTRLPSISVSGSRIALTHVSTNHWMVAIYQFHPSWFRKPLTVRDLGTDNLISGVDIASLPDEMRVETLPLPQHEQVITTSEVVKHVWMEQDLLITVSREGVQYASA
ncbi:hypothetical protein BDN72DRAFT_849286 [Pluteus cervinus]|uniref:Uncharacterized protein n=1 Tax=Pluteus cervinus TaxID=181527 RepID=A0ACD3A8C7_9AGAR|nr:hypothetical protein BDN72DRAFT_849286 [Pluteus cervinus]